MRKHLIMATVTSAFLTIARASTAAAPATGQTVSQPWHGGNAGDHHFFKAEKSRRTPLH